MSSMDISAGANVRKVSYETSSSKSALGVVYRSASWHHDRSLPLSEGTFREVRIGRTLKSTRYIMQASALQVCRRLFSSTTSLIIN